MFALNTLKTCIMCIRYKKDNCIFRLYYGIFNRSVSLRFCQAIQIQFVFDSVGQSNRDQKAMLQ